MTSVTDKASSKFSYADPATAAAVVDTFASTDVFYVDGVTATIGAFTAALTVGDLVTILADTPTTGVTTYKLVNKTAADYTSGLVGIVNTGATAPATSFTIIEPITGTALNTINPYTGSYTTYTVNGAAASQSVFESNINEGDTVAITGKDTAASPRTIALTNTTVTGTVSTPATYTQGGSAIVEASFFVDTAAGAILGDQDQLAIGDGDTVGYYIHTTGSVLTVDGVTATVATFGADLSAGDTVTYARAAGVQTIALTNKAPLAIHGQITASDLAGAGTFTYVPAGGDSTAVTTPVVITLTVDGVLATAAEVDADVSLGDTVVYQAADATTSTTASLALTNATINATVDSATTVVGGGTPVVGVFAAGDKVALGTFDYTSSTALGLTGTSVEYQVNGAVKLVGPFETSLTGIVNGSLTGTIKVTQSGTKTIFALTTAIA